MKTRKIISGYYEVIKDGVIYTLRKIHLGKVGASPAETIWEVQIGNDYQNTFQANTKREAIEMIKSEGE